jgi:transcriptional regulator with XRE-family HTH domain
MMAQRSRQGAELNPVGGLQALAKPGDLEVGSRIRVLRAEKGWSARELAERCLRGGISALSRSAISKLETGARDLKAEEAQVLAEIFGVSMDFLLTGVPTEADAPGPVRRLAGKQAAGGRGSARASSLALSEVRRPEVDELIRLLQSKGGPQTLLVLGPPGIGKSTLASQLIGEASKANAGWATRLLDVRDQEPEAKADAELLISRMFDLESLAQGRHDTHMQMFEDGTASLLIAQQISRGGKPMLCVIDSADELSDATSTRLRSVLSAVYDQVEETGNPQARLALIVASRLKDGWVSVTPKPKFSEFSLPEFGVEVIEDKLREAAGTARVTAYSAAQFTELATFVQGITAGLPPLLEPFLSWIGNEQWLRIGRLENTDVFESLAGPYVHDTLLARESLFPRAVQVSAEQMAAVHKAVGLLVRYRFLTRSHVQYHIDNDGGFREILEHASWKLEDLWSVLSGMALLRKPPDGVWPEFYPAIRKLLFRHFYPSTEQRAAAHRDAQAFITDWANEQPPKESVVGRLEGLWHATAAIRLEPDQNVPKALLAVAREFGTGLRLSETYPLDDLREYAVDRIRRDAELQAAIGDIDGLSAELDDAVMAWT